MMKRTLGLAAMLAMSPAVASADVVTDWNAIMLDIVQGSNPFFQSRWTAITQLAVFEAVNAITGDYAPYLGTVAAPEGASAEAAAIVAAHDALAALFSTDAARLATLAAHRDASLAAIPDGQAKEDGKAVGAAAAAAILANRAGDVPPPAFYNPTSTDPGQWQKTAGCPAPGGVLVHWANVRPFGVASSSQFRPDPPPAISSNAYAKDYNEVKDVGAAGSTDRPQDRADVAVFYNLTGAGHVFNPAASQVALAQGRSLSENARMFALLNIAIADGLIASMEAKYHYTFWRPETAIPRGDEDGSSKTDQDTSYTPFIGTPCFPSYPSAHAGASYSARKVLERILGAGGHDITLSNGGITLHYSSFHQITNDVDDARVYGGIHFRFDQDEGGRMGRRIGSYVLKNHLRHADGGEDNGVEE